MKHSFLDTLTPELILFMEQKYQNSFLTHIFLQKKFVEKGIDLKYYCLYSVDLKPTDILVFFVKGNTAVVVNWLIEIPKELAAGFELAIYEAYPRVSRITWQMTLNRVDTKVAFSFLDNSDMCILLPSSVEEYNKMLSSNSRRIYNNKTHRIERDMDQMVIDRPVIAQDLYMVDVLSQWKQKQMQQRGEKSMVAADVVKDVLLQIGSVSYIKKNDSFISICLFYKVGKHIYLEQTAYDERYSRYSPGRVLIYQSILKFIEQGATHFHFLWKGADYKKHYSAQEIQVFTTKSYRSKSFLYYYDFLKNSCHMALRKFAHTSIGQHLRRWVNKTFNG